MKPLQRQVMAALAAGCVLAGLLVGQVGAFHFPKRAVQEFASQEYASYELASFSEQSSETSVLSSYWSAKILRWETLIVQEANRRSLDPDFVASLVWRESRGDPNAIGPGDSVGLMQIMPKEAGFSWRPSKEVLLDPGMNLFWGTRTLSIIIRQGNGDVFNALAAYNGGWDQTDYRRPRTFAMTILRDYAHALAARCGTGGRWVAFFAVESSYLHGPIWVADSARSDVYYYGQTNAIPDGTPLIPNIAPTSVVARFTSEASGAPYSVGIWLYNVAQNTWDGCALSQQVTAALPPTATPAVTPTPRPTMTPMVIVSAPTATPDASAALPASTALPTPTPTFVPLFTPAPGGELAAALDAVVLDRGADLRPGATLWWNPSTTLPAGATVRVLGYDPDTPAWVYVSSADGRVSGWVQTMNLRLPNAPHKLSLVTPIPTLTPSPTATLTPTPTPTVACPGGPFWAEAWPLRTYRSPEGGWVAVIYARGHGGTCEYTYRWNVDVEQGPTFDGVFFEFHQDRYEALIGTVTVCSGVEEISVAVYVPSP
ncbi:MAG: transglycosylase SLT domain-containing protein [Anaerolineae bacterium]|nr:transglycosylase SLT domain-containing protein [Anaerolineae bacterium]